MATLEDSFLRDLEDLSDDSGGEEDDRDAALPENDQVSPACKGLSQGDCSDPFPRSRNAGQLVYT